MDALDVLAPLDVGIPHHDLPVEAPGRISAGVKNIPCGWSRR
jgi:hypothetical protein